MHWCKEGPQSHQAVFAIHINDEPDDDDEWNDELQPPHIIDEGINKPSSEIKDDENSSTKLMKQLQHQHYHQDINVISMTIKYFKVNTQTQETYLISMTAKDR